MADADISAEDAYSHLGFQPFSGDGPFVEAAEWKRIQDSKLLVDIRQRYLLQKERAGEPLVDAGYVIGRVPALRLAAGELEKLLLALDEGLQAGCRTVADWQAREIARRAQQRPR